MNAIAARLGRIPVGGGFRQDDYWVWGSSVVRGPDGHYHMFASRIPRALPFHPGWMVASEIVRAEASVPEGPYTFREVVLPPRGAEYWDGRSTHNPRVLQAHGRYYLFYMGSTHPLPEPDPAGLTARGSAWSVVARANKRIGVAVSDDPRGPWRRCDAPALPTRPGTFYSFLTSNPTPAIGPDGACRLVFKARAYRGDVHGPMTIGLALSEDPCGPYRVLGDAPVIDFDRVGEVEDPCLWHDADGYHMLAKDQHGGITGERGAGVLLHSDDACDWRLDAEPKAYSRTVTWDDGTVEHLGNLERCSILRDADGRVSHLFFALWQGSEDFSRPSDRSVARNICLPLRD